MINVLRSFGLTEKMLVQTHDLFRSFVVKVETVASYSSSTINRFSSDSSSLRQASKYLTAEEILKSSNTKTQAQLDAERKAREAAEAKAKADAKEREALIAGLRDAARQGVPGTPNPGREGILATKEMRDYYNQLVAFLQPQWKAVSPSNIELGGKVTNWPIVDLAIEKDGKVIRTSVVSRSGNRAVDDAVNTFLANLKVVPVPPQAGVIRVTLEIQ